MPLLIAALLVAAALVTPGTPAVAQTTAWQQDHAVREGDRLQTHGNSRLVVEIGPNRLKLDERSALVVRRIDRDGVELDLERGSVVLELRSGDSAWRWQVDTAAGRHQPHGPGLFRIDAPDPRGFDTGSATAWRSALRIESEDGTLLLPPGRRAERDRSGRWQVGFPEADAFAAWAMVPQAENPPPAPDDWRDRERGDRRPRHWHAAPSWDVPMPTPPQQQQQPRVIVVPAPVWAEPAPQQRQWNPQPDPREAQRQRRWTEPAPPAAARPAPMPAPLPAPTATPERRHHEVSPAPPMPAAPAASAPSLPQPRPGPGPGQEEPRRSQRAL
jgi:hypothetical protein